MAGRLILEADATRVAQLLERLRPERMLLLLVDPVGSSFWDSVEAKLLPHYGVKYVERWGKWLLSGFEVAFLLLGIGFL